MTTKMTSFRIAVAQASSFGLSPAPGMIWVTHEGFESPGRASVQDAKHEAPGVRAAALRGSGDAVMRTVAQVAALTSPLSALPFCVLNAMPRMAKPSVF